MPPVDSSGPLKSSRVDGDLLELDCRETGREHEGLANSVREQEIKHDSVGLSTDERNQRKLNIEDENYIDIEKPNIEPEAEIQCGEIARLNIDVDLIGEIMCRASWREISVLRCVSKQFANPVNSADFLLQLIKKGNKEADVLAGIFYHDYSDKTRSIINGRRIIFQVKFIPMSKWSNILHGDELKNRGLNALNNIEIVPQNFHIQECRHGLLLCTRITDHSPWNIAQGEDHQIDGYYVCNPITRKHCWLPMPPESSPKYSRTAFLVDKETGHYQVVKMPLTSDLVGEECFTGVHIYSSLLSCWRTCRYQYQCSESRRTISPLARYLTERPTIQIGNSLYWIDGHSEIVCCDIEQETVEFVKHPDYNQSIYSLCLGEYQGMLQCASLCSDNMILLWSLEQGQWKFVTEIPHVELKPAFSGDDGLNFSIHALDQERIFLTASDKMVCYNFVSNMVETHMRFGEDDILGRKAVLPYLLPKLPLPLF